MTAVHSEHYLPARSAAGRYDVAVTPESARWGYSGLRVLTMPSGGRHSLATGGEEIVVVPLSGGVELSIGDTQFELAGRADVFAGPTDVAYLPCNAEVELSSTAGGRFALCGARTDQALPPAYLPAAQVPVELRGAGQSSRQVRNFGTPGVLAASRIIACEVITPDGNWSSYPAHKHDQASDHESELEEIYYFEIAPGPSGESGFGYMRTSSSPGHDIDLLEEVHDGDVVLVPYGWHGPCVTAPGFPMYYLNVMAGPGERAWLITDHPDQAWIRSTWAGRDVDPRLAGKDTVRG